MALPRPVPRAARAHWRVDIALAACVTALTVAGVLVSDAGSGDDGAVQVGLAAAMGVLLWWRRTAPLAVFAVSTACIATASVMQWPPGWQPVAWLIAAYALGAHSSRSRAVLGLGLGLVAVAGLVLVEAPYFDSWLAVGSVLQLIVAWLLGVGVRASRTERETSVQRAADAHRRAAVVSAEAAREERLRVARDLHDTVTNELSAVTLQATVLRRTHPGAVTAHLAAIEASGHSALVDLRRMLGALRTGSGAGVPAPLLPASVSGDESPDGARLDASLTRVTGWAPAPPSASWSAPPAQRRSQWPVDVAFALAVAAINVTGSIVPDPFDPTPYREPVLPVLVLLAAAPGLSLVVRRRWPAVPLALAVGVVLVFDALLWQHGNLPLTVLLAAFAVGAWADPRRGALTVAVAAAAVLAVHPFTPVGRTQDDLWLLGPLLLLPWLVGLAVRHARLKAARAQATAVAAEAQAARLRTEAVTGERLRVARDLHDVVGHRLAEIVVQVVTARRIAGPELDEELAAVESAARSAMDAMRSMLDSLGADDSPVSTSSVSTPPVSITPVSPAPVSAAPVSPAPGWADIASLAARHRAAHGPVHLTLDPTLDEVSGESAALTAYRVVQEALANAARHAPGAAVTISVRAQREGIEIVVDDDGRVPIAAGGPPHARVRGSGLGLMGMRERVTLAGGTLEAGLGEGGFRVRAVLPGAGTGR